MKKILNWNIYNQEIVSVIRYCHNCGKKVLFTDTLKRRQNANGKNIYHFAIYKCQKNHTFNKKISTFKTYSSLENKDGLLPQVKTENDELTLEQINHYELIEIYLKIVQKKERIDKFLSSKILDISRNELVRFIEEGFIQVNQSVVGKNYKLKENDCISIHL